jgi:glycosyltransferase involved in cell wall biosynthesis
LKIVILGTAYPLRGGIAHYVALLYENLKKKHDVSIVTFKLQYPKLLFPGKTQEEKGDGSAKIESKQLMNTINPFSWLRTAIYLIRLKPDLLIFKYWMPFFAPCYGTICFITKMFHKMKIFYVCDNIIPHEKRFGDIFLTKYAFKSVDGCIVQSESVKKDLLYLFPEKKYINIPHPVYTIFGSTYQKEKAKELLKIKDEKVILFFGYVRAYKGLNVLISALPFILDNVKVKLYVVGEFYGDYEKYVNQIKLLRLENDITIISDYIPNEEVGKYFSAADVVVLPYITATQSGIVQIAYNFNKPVIATDVGGLAETVLDGKTGYIVKPQNPKLLANTVSQFYLDNKEDEFVANVMKEKKKYSWDRMVEGIEELYASFSKDS